MRHQDHRPSILPHPPYLPRANCRRAATAALILWSIIAVATHDGLASSDPPDSPAVLITEVMVNPASNERSGRTEWVELANAGTTDVTMNGWRLRDEDRTTWGVFDCHLPSGAVVVLVNAAFVDAEDFHQAWSADPNAPTYDVVPVKWGALSNQPSATDERLELVDAAGCVVCAVNLGGDEHWPRITGVGGPSYWLSDPSASTLNSGMVWHVSKAGEAGAIQSRRSGVFEGLDIGSPGFVPWLRLGVSESAGNDHARREGDNARHEGDRTIDYESIAPVAAPWTGASGVPPPAGPTPDR